MAKKQTTVMDEAFEDTQLTAEQIRQLPQDEIEQLVSGAKYMISNFMPPNQMHIMYNEQAKRITLLVNHEVFPIGNVNNEQIETILAQRNTGTIDYTGMEGLPAPTDAVEFVLPEHLSTLYPEIEMIAKTTMAMCLKFAQANDPNVDRIVQQEIRDGVRNSTGNPVLDRALFFLDVFEMLTGALLLLEADRNAMLTQETIAKLLEQPAPTKPKKQTSKANQPPTIMTNRTIGRA